MTTPNPHSTSSRIHKSTINPLQQTEVDCHLARVFVITYMLRVINADSKKKKKWAQWIGKVKRSSMLSVLSSVSLTCPPCVLHIIYAWSVHFQSHVHFPSLTIPCLDDAEQIETDIASARETFADASAGSTRYPGSSSRSWTKSQRVKYVPPPSHALATTGPTLLTVHIHIHRRSTARRSACRETGRR